MRTQPVAHTTTMAQLTKIAPSTAPLRATVPLQSIHDTPTGLALIALLIPHLELAPHGAALARAIGHRG